MTDTLNLALQLLLVGMLSVFTILAIVVGIGRLLITLVNKYSPEPVKTVLTSRPSHVISSKKLAVLSSVIDIVTDQQGVIKSVKKI